MDDLTRFAQIATQLAQDEPEVEPQPIPLYARGYRNAGYYVCSPGCGKLFTDIASKNQHQAQFCRYTTARESERSLSSQRMMGA